MKEKSKLKRLSRWGVPLALATVCLVNHQSEITVQANEPRASHIGTFEGETTFSLSSDTGILPSIEIETKDVYGNTHQYQSEGGNLVIPDTEDGITIQSAILKGQTLVNLVSRYENSNGALKATIHNVFEANKEYIVRIYNNPFNVTVRQIIVRGHGYQYSYFAENVVFSHSSSRAYNQVYVGLEKEDGTIPTVDEIEQVKVLVLEYQDRMEDWDIPYFEGMRSVKIPVLTISNEDGSETAEITLEEDLVLRSNGMVYDELDLVTGKFTQRLDENNEVLDEEVVQYVKVNSTHTFGSIQEGDISVKGTIAPTLGSITVPTDALTFTLNPNLERDQQFIAPDFSISNESLSPIGLELKSFEQVTNVLNDVLPDKYDSWEGLNRKQSQDIALALIPQVSDGWISLNEGSYYVANTSNAKLGQIKGNSTVDFKFSACHGQAFSEPLSPQYKLTFVFEL